MKILVKSHLGGYTVSREWVMEEYKHHLLRKRRLAKNLPPIEAPVDLNNSEPWMKNPKTVDDLWRIAQHMNKRVKEHDPKKPTTQSADSLAKAETAEQANSILADYFDYEICKRGLKNPHPEVRNIILEELRILAADGDSFAKEILEKIN